MRGAKWVLGSGELEQWEEGNMQGKKQRKEQGHEKGGGEGTQSRGEGINTSHKKGSAISTLCSRAKGFPVQDFLVTNGKLAWGEDHLKFNTKVYLNWFPKQPRAMRWNNKAIKFLKHGFRTVRESREKFVHTVYCHCHPWRHFRTFSASYFY